MLGSHIFIRRKSDKCPRVSELRRGDEVVEVPADDLHRARPLGRRIGAVLDRKRSHASTELWACTAHPRLFGQQIKSAHDVVNEPVSGYRAGVRLRRLGTDPLTPDVVERSRCLLCSGCAFVRRRVWTLEPAVWLQSVDVSLATLGEDDHEASDTADRYINLMAVNVGGLALRGSGWPAVGS